MMTTTDPKTKRAALRALPSGAELREWFVVQRVDKRTTRRGKPYLAVVLADAAGLLDGRVWDAKDGDEAPFQPGKPVTITGVIDVFMHRPQLVIRSVQPADDDAGGDVPWDELVPQSRSDPRRLYQRLVQILASIRHPPLVALCRRYFADSEFLWRFVRWPAAAKYHHAWKHGLLEHTVSALELAGRICQHYPHIDRDLVVMGVFLHDTGKIYEFEETPTGSVQYTPHGRLVGHISIGVAMLERKLAGIPDFPPLLAHHLRHIILSHHGQLEFGSPKMPMSPEAMIVHHVECLDSEIATFLQETDNLAPIPPEPITSNTPTPSPPPPATESAPTAASERVPAFVYSSRFRREIMVFPPTVPPSPPLSPESPTD